MDGSRDLRLINVAMWRQRESFRLFRVFFFVFKFCGAFYMPNNSFGLDEGAKPQQKSNCLNRRKNGVCWATRLNGQWRNGGRDGLNRFAVV